MRSTLSSFLVLCFAVTVPARAADAPKELWLYYPTNMLVEKNLDKAQEIWSRAAKAGYTHVLLADSKLSRLPTLDKRYFNNVERAKKIAADLKLALVPALFSVGYSNDLLSNDPNLAEGLPVRDQPFVVAGGQAKPVHDSAVTSFSPRLRQACRTRSAASLISWSNIRTPRIPSGLSL